MRISFAFRSLIRTSGYAESTFARKSKRKMVFPFAFRSLIRTFGLRPKVLSLPYNKFV